VKKLVAKAKMLLAIVIVNARYNGLKGITAG
jgi:hypothetical protein